MWMHLGMKKCRAPSLGPCDIGFYSDLVSRNCFESGAYLLYSLRQGFQRTCNGLAVFWPTMDLAEI